MYRGCNKFHANRTWRNELSRSMTKIKRDQNRHHKSHIARNWPELQGERRRQFHQTYQAHKKCPLWLLHPANESSAAPSADWPPCWWNLRRLGKHDMIVGRAKDSCRWSTTHGFKIPLNLCPKALRDWLRDWRWATEGIFGHEEKSGWLICERVSGEELEGKAILKGE